MGRCVTVSSDSFCVHEVFNISIQIINNNMKPNWFFQKTLEVNNNAFLIGYE